MKQLSEKENKCEQSKNAKPHEFEGGVVDASGVHEIRKGLVSGYSVQQVRKEIEQSKNQQKEK